MKRLWIPLTIALIPSFTFAASVEDELIFLESEFKCPSSVKISHFLDGGTISVAITNEQSDTYSLCIDGRKIVFKPKRPLSRKEKKVLEKGRELKVFLRVRNPDHKNAIIVEYKSVEEKRLRDLLQSWIDCDPMANGALQEFIERLDEERIQKYYRNPNQSSLSIQTATRPS